jgi:hypothetical protein
VEEWEIDIGPTRDTCDTPQHPRSINELQRHPVERIAVLTQLAIDVRPLRPKASLPERLNVAG